MPFAKGPVLFYVGAGQYKTVGVTEYVGATEIITIPDGFVSDLASVPRWAWALLPPTGAYEDAALAHDYYCTELNAGRCQVSSRDVDGLLRRIAREGSTGLIRRWWLWTGARWGALRNPHRRAQWWKDSPAVLGITALSLAVPLALIVGLDVAVHAIIHAL